MDGKMNQHLSQKMLQKLSPQQIQLMKLLQIPTVLLEQRIKEELETNPALEEGSEAEVSEMEVSESPEDFLRDGNREREVAESKEDDRDEDDGDAPYDEPEVVSFEEQPMNDDIEFEEYMNEYLEDDTSSYKLNVNNYSSDEEEKTIPIAVENSFHDSLDQQLGMLNLDERQLKIARQIIGSIDDDGYLRREPISIADDLLFSQNVVTDEQEVQAILEQIQDFEPAGIGARDLQECLLIQLRRKLRIETENKDSHFVRLAVQILEKNFDEFSKKHYQKLQKQYNLKEDDLKDVIDEIIHLNPKPASGYIETSRSLHYIIPDFIIENKGAELELSLNTRNAPDLRISDHYRDMLKSYSISKTKSRQEREAIMFIKQKIDAAKWFIDAIRQRQQTMYKTMYAIQQYQYEFFLTGDERKLKPMILKDIADLTGLDISTVSRVANSKYVQTEFGTKRLKDFFSESLQTDTGEEVSTLEVKKILTDLIGKENKRKPLSDEKLKDLLRKAGYNIARRTVAKYREQLNIQVARLRKEL